MHRGKKQSDAHKTETAKQAEGKGKREAGEEGDPRKAAVGKPGEVKPAAAAESVEVGSEAAVVPQLTQDFTEFMTKRQQVS